MTVPYVGHLNARLRARFHVQVELTRVPSGCKTPGAVPVVGRVVRVFRGNSILSIGDQLTFDVRVFRPGNRLPVGAYSMLYESLVQGPGIWKHF